MNTGVLGIALFLVPLGASAQWLHYPSPNTPRTKDGKPNLTAPAPRAADGKPDLSGIWVPEPTPVAELQALRGPDSVQPAEGSEPPNKYFITILADFKSGQAPLQPTANVQRVEPALSCLPFGMPIFDTMPTPRKIVQLPGLLLMLGEYDETFRQIFTDGRKLPADPEPSWLGWSVGRWEGDTMVIDTVGTNGRSSLDLFGHMHSDQLRITERLHRVSFGTIDLQLTLDDPKTFTRPLTVRFNLSLMPDTDLLESFCSENEKDHIHSVP